MAGEIKVTFQMKECVLDQLEKNDHVGVHLLDEGDAMFGQYAGLVMDHDTREWFFELVDAYGKSELISTRRPHVLYRVSVKGANQ